MPRIRRIFLQRGWYWAAFRTAKSRRPFIISSQLESLYTRLRKKKLRRQSAR